MINTPDRIHIRRLVFIYELPYEPDVYSDRFYFCFTLAPLFVCAQPKTRPHHKESFPAYRRIRRGRTYPAPFHLKRPVARSFFSMEASCLPAIFLTLSAKRLPAGSGRLPLIVQDTGTANGQRPNGRPPRTGATAQGSLAQTGRKTAYFGRAFLERLARSRLHAGLPRRACWSGSGRSRRIWWKSISRWSDRPVPRPTAARTLLGSLAAHTVLPPWRES